MEKKIINEKQLNPHNKKVVAQKLAAKGEDFKYEGLVEVTYSSENVVANVEPVEAIKKEKKKKFVKDDD